MLKIPKTLPVTSLLPTQGAVGKHQVNIRAKKLRKMKDHELVAYLEARPVPVVLDRKGNYYSIDRHHLCAACIINKIDQVFIVMIADFSDTKTEAEFWTRMQDAHYVLLQDAQGVPIRPDQLPSSMNTLDDDPFRSLAGMVRDAGAIHKVDTPFNEFVWAAFFRQHIDMVEDMIHSKFETCMKMARSDLAKNLPGYKEGL